MQQLATVIAIFMPLAFKSSSSTDSFYRKGLTMTALHRCILGLLVMLHWSPSAGMAGEGQCECCGRCCGCEKVCRLVCEMKETTKITWSCKCEDFCVPGKSQRCAASCDCGHCSKCREESWVPTAAYIKTRKVPVKHIEKIPKPSYRLVVEYLCTSCAAAK